MSSNCAKMKTQEGVGHRLRRHNLPAGLRKKGVVAYVGKTVAVYCMHDSCAAYLMLYSLTGKKCTEFARIFVVLLGKIPQEYFVYCKGF